MTEVVADTKGCGTPKGRGPRSVAVLIPAYNPGSGRLERTLASIDAQQAEAVVIVVVDDGSEPAIQIDPSRYVTPVELLRCATNGGIVTAMNFGLRHIQSCGFDYIARQDVGDVDVGPRLERQRRALDEDPGLSIVGSHVRWVEPDGRPAFTFEAPAEHGLILQRMRSGPAFIHPAVMMRASAISAVGPYSDQFPHCEDYELFFRLVRHGRGANVPEVLVDTELDPGGISIPKRRKQLWGRLRVQWAYFGWFSLRAWIGLARTLALIATPYSVLAPIKRRFKTIR